jgi:hypothetical protein
LENIFLPSDKNPGIFTKISIDNKGIVTYGELLNQNDIPDLNHDKIIDLENKILDYKITDFIIPDKNLNMNSYKITNVSDPINNQDVVTKKYFDDNISSIELPNNII